MTNERTELRGANCTFEYTFGGKRTFVAPVRSIGHSFSVVATESKARIHRAFYPHQRAEGPFQVQLELNGYPIFARFMNFMRSYVQASNVSINRGMSVYVPAVEFWRIGVPVNGISDGDHVGSNVFMPTLVFESAIDPLDPRLITGIDGGDRFSTYDANDSEADEAGRFFYPASSLTNDPNARGESIYDSLPTPPPTALIPGTGASGRNRALPY